MDKIKYGELGFFRFKEFRNGYLLTNDVGQWLVLKEKEFKDLLAGDLDKAKEPYLSLKEKNFLKDIILPPYIILLS